MNSCCFTGYRPGKFPFPLREGNRDYESLKTDITAALLDLEADGITTFYSGAAMGFDLIAAEQALELRDNYKSTELRVICAIPFAEQAVKYPREWRERYKNVLARSDGVVLVSDVYFTGCYQQRNRWMVDHADTVLTWFDGQSGGTRNTLNYAEKQHKKIINLNRAQKENNMYSLFDV